MLKKLIETYRTKKTIKAQQKIADEVLALLAHVDRLCIVAGGAPRDWYLGKPATDIDVYFHAEYGREPLQKMLVQLGFDIGKQSSAADVPAAYDSNTELESVMDCIYKGQKIQFMNMTSAFSVVKVVGSFPVSISQAWYRKGKLNTTKLFDMSVKNKVVMRTGKEYNKKEAYVAKIKGKFPDYQFVGF